LYANGVDTGLEGLLEFQNGWKLTFDGLPFRDINDNVIVYTDYELWQESGWEIYYGDMNYISGTPGKYSTTITNRNSAGYSIEMPATGSFSPVYFAVVGAAITISSFIGGCMLRRKRERRVK
jgi:hypothetical protein